MFDRVHHDPPVHESASVVPGVCLILAFVAILIGALLA